MSEDSTGKSLDILGVKPIADSINKITDVSVTGAASFLRLICRPAAEEYGLLLHDKVKIWRNENMVRMLLKAEAKFQKLNLPTSLHAQPRLVSEILEKGSWAEDHKIQDMWSGLLTSSCSEQPDDGNLIFVTLLSQITSMEAKILNYVCINSSKVCHVTRLIMANDFVINLDALKHISECEDVDRLDRELDHLRFLGLIDGGFVPSDIEHVHITPTTIALHMFVRCQGEIVSVAEYFNLVLPDNEFGQRQSPA